MPKEGHQPRRSERDPAVIREAAVMAESRPSRITLPYFKMAGPLRPAIRRRLGIVNEIAGPESIPALEARLPDAAVASFGSAIILEVVIGNDDRVKVSESDIQRNPFRQICALRIQAQSGNMYVGTGWFIGPRAVATAGHCVYMQKEGGWAKSIDVIPDKFGTQQPYGQVSSTRFRAVDGWTENQSVDVDYGVILLEDETAGKRVGWFDVAAEQDANLKGAMANISGYPADRENANFQYFHARPLSAVTKTRLEYDIDTFGGQSGSPIWIDTSEGIVAVGVHTNGATTGNSGTRISEDVIQNLSAWRDE